MSHHHHHRQHQWFTAQGARRRQSAHVAGHARCSVPSGMFPGSTLDWHGPHCDRFRMTPVRPAIGSSSLGIWQCTCFVHLGKTKKDVTLCTKTCKAERRGVPFLQKCAACARQFGCKEDHQKVHFAAVPVAVADSTSTAGDTMDDQSHSDWHAGTDLCCVFD